MTQGKASEKGSLVEERLLHLPNTGKRQGGKAFMVMDIPLVKEENEVHLDEIPATVASMMAEVQSPDLFAVLDSGATESVWALQSLERIHRRRTEQVGVMEVTEVVPSAKKPFIASASDMVRRNTQSHLHS